MRCFSVFSAIALMVCFVGMAPADDKEKPASPIKSHDGALVLTFTEGKLAVTNVQDDKRWTFDAPLGSILAAAFAPKGFKAKGAASGHAVFWASATHLGALDPDGKEVWRFQLAKEKLDKAALSFALNKEVENKRWNLLTLTGGQEPLHFEMDTGRLVLKGKE